MRRDVGSREQLALLVGTLIHGVRQEIRPDTAVVEQRVAFARRSVADDGATLPSRLYKELEEPALRVLHALLKGRSEEHTSELQSQSNLVCRLLLEKKKHAPERQPLRDRCHRRA